MNGEDDLVEWLRRLLPSPGPGRSLEGPGDDAAVLGRGASARAVSVDQQIAGVHLPGDVDPRVWARRLLAVNLSDLAAMGARPLGALLTLAVPADFPARRFLRAASDACRARGLRLVGGDIAQSPVAVTTMTLIGTRPSGGRWVRRDVARPGDRLWLGGPVGLSALGQRLVSRGARLKGNRIELPALDPDDQAARRTARRAVRRHLAPDPQLALGEWLGRRRAAAIDVSDGLARDCHRLCRASGVGAVLDPTALPSSPTLEALAAGEGASFESLSLGGGEDYVLLFALGPRTHPPARFGAFEVGRVTGSRGLWTQVDGRRKRLAATGWDHLAPGTG